MKNEAQNCSFLDKLGQKVVVQLADQLFRTQEDLGLNPAIGKLLKYIQLVIRKYQNKEKEAGNGPFFKKRGTESWTFILLQKDTERKEIERKKDSL